MVGTVFQFGRPDLDQEELEHAIQDTRIKMAQQGCQALIHLAEKFERELTSDAEFPITGYIYFLAGCCAKYESKKWKHLLRKSMMYLTQAVEAGFKVLPEDTGVSIVEVLNRLKSARL